VRITARLVHSAPPEVPLLAAMASVQLGAAFAALVFAKVGPAGVTLLRVLLTAIVLLAITRPRLRGRSRRDLGLVAVYGITVATMNWCFYEALQRVPQGVAVTIEFLGPLGVAVAGSRRLRDVGWAALAAAGVALLALRGDEAGVQTAGILFALGAAGCWALYILLAKRVTHAVPAMEALGLGCAVGTLVVLPAGVIEGGATLLDPAVLGACLGVAMLSSLVPYTLELIALRRLSTAVFGLLMSLEPAIGALAGVIVLGQHLTGVMLVAMAMVISASIATSLTSRRVSGERPLAG
jgi:inner membrane transporter RhtA